MEIVLVLYSFQRIICWSLVVLSFPGGGGPCRRSLGWSLELRALDVREAAIALRIPVTFDVEIVCHRQVL